LYGSDAAACTTAVCNVSFLEVRPKSSDSATATATDSAKAIATVTAKAYSKTTPSEKDETGKTNLCCEGYVDCFHRGLEPRRHSPSTAEAQQIVE
jgi:hypothetical protein